MISFKIVKRNEGLDYWSKEDYYFSGNNLNIEVISGKEYWNVKENFNFSDLQRIVDKRLDGRKKRSNDRLALDYTFSLPKSVSLLFAFSDDKDKILEIHRKAIEKTIDYIKENGFIYSNKMVNGKEKKAKVKKESILAIRVDHASSRALDPQLHSHVLIANICETDNNWKKINYGDLLFGQKLLGNLYRQYIASELEKLGYVVEWKENSSFEIVGFSEDEIKYFSKRREEILNTLEKLNLEKNNKTQGMITLTTRQTKQNISQEDLINYWQQKKEEINLDIQKIKEINKLEKEKENLTTKLEKELFIRSFIQNIIKEKILLDGYIKKEDLFLKTLLGLSENGYTVDMDNFQKVFDNEFDNYFQKKGLVILNKDDLDRNIISDQKLYSSFSLNNEINIRDNQKSLNKQEVKEKLSELNKKLLKEKGFSLSDDQLKMLENVAVRDTDFAIVGKAGAGKTTIMKLLNSVYNGKTLGLSLSGNAAFNLEKESGIRSFTIDSIPFLINKLEKEKDNVDLIVVDESGMVDSKHFLLIKQLANKLNAKVLYVGDPDQLKPVGSGDIFTGLIRDAMSKGSFGMLGQIFRQRDEKYREAVIHASVNNSLKSFQLLEELGSVEYTKTEKEKIIKLVDEYKKLIDNGSNVKSILAVAHSKRNVDNLNASIRNMLKEKGIINSVEYTFELRDGKKRRMERNLTVGDRIVFLRNDSKLGVKNGMFGIIRDIDFENKRMKIEIDGYKTVSVNLNEYNYLDHGYATTIHKSQGLTVGHVLVFGENKFNSNLYYVGISRGKHSCKLFLREKDKNIFLERIQEKEKKINLLDIQDSQKEYDKNYDAISDVKTDLKEKSVLEYVIFDDGNKKIISEIANNTLNVENVNKEIASYFCNAHDRFRPDVRGKLEEELISETEIYEEYLKKYEKELEKEKEVVKQREKDLEMLMI